jgi:hypothetical protein
VTKIQVEPVFYKYLSISDVVVFAPAPHNRFFRDPATNNIGNNFNACDVQRFKFSILTYRKIMRGNTYEMPSIYRKNATICKHMYLFTHSVTYYGFTPP